MKNRLSDIDWGNAREGDISHPLASILLRHNDTTTQVMSFVRTPDLEIITAQLRQEMEDTCDEISREHPAAGREIALAVQLFHPSVHLPVTREAMRHALRHLLEFRMPKVELHDQGKFFMKGKRGETPLENATQSLADGKEADTMPRL